MMFLKKWFPVAALAVVPFAAGQGTPASHDVVTQAAVAELHYASPFTAYRALEESGTTPDLVWRQANDDMRALGGHAGHLSHDSPQQPPQVEMNTASKRSVSTGHGKDH